MIYDKETPISHIEAVIYNKSGEVVEKLNGKDFLIKGARNRKDKCGKSSQVKYRFSDLCL